MDMLIRARVEPGSRFADTQPVPVFVFVRHRLHYPGSMARVYRSRAGALVAALALVAPAGASATFPGDNGLIAFQDDSIGGIYTINPDGSQRTRLGDGFEPAWSPSGRRIAFVKNTSGGIGNTELFTMKSNGSHTQRVTHSAGSEWEPAYSADGKRIVYRVGKFRSAGGKLYTIPAGGGARKKLGTGQNPDWSVETQGAAKGLIVSADDDAPDPCFGSIELFTQTPAGRHRTLLPFGCPHRVSAFVEPQGR